jgi:hypothetical protein
VKGHKWFDDIDFEDLYYQDLEPPFTPEVIKIDEATANRQMERAADLKFDPESVTDHYSKSIVTSKQIKLTQKYHDMFAKF